jgi:hypothetical protein
VILSGRRHQRPSLISADWRRVAVTGRGSPASSAASASALKAYMSWDGRCAGVLKSLKRQSGLEVFVLEANFARCGLIGEG